MSRVLRLSLAFVTIIALAACGSTSTASTMTQSFTVTAKEFGFESAQLAVTAASRLSSPFRIVGLWSTTGV
jgi:hypothetical protein